MTELHPVGLIHFAVGTVALLAGAVALLFRKGSGPHRGAGHIFFFCMLALGISGIYFSYSRSILFTWFLAIMAIYLVTTGWMTARREEGTIGRTEKLACIFILSSGLVTAGIGVAAMMGVAGLTDEVPAATYFVWAALSTWFGTLDARVIRRGGISGKHRIARHLWRILSAMFIAVTIFFLGNNWVLPELLRTELILITPIVVVAVLMVFWLVRVLLTKWYEQQSTGAVKSSPDTP